MEGMSRRAYARYRGCSERAVRKALEAGRIGLNSDGLIDPKVADREWEANTNPYHGGKRQPTQPEPWTPPTGPIVDFRDRLADAVKVAPELARWEAFVNWLPARFMFAIQENWESGLDSPVETAEDFHFTLVLSLVEFLEETGVIDEEKGEEIGHALVPGPCVHKKLPAYKPHW